MQIGIIPPTKKLIKKHSKSGNQVTAPDDKKHSNKTQVSGINRLCTMTEEKLT